MYRYFAYGSNLHPTRLGERVGRLEPLATAELTGWYLAFNKRSQDGSGKCHISETGDRQDRVWGAIYELDPGQQRMLHHIEGVGRGYHVTHLTLTGVGEVFTYTAMPEYLTSELDPFEWYLELILAGARLHGFPEAYIERITGVQVQPDPDERRDRRHRRLLP